MTWTWLWIILHVFVARNGRTQRLNTQLSLASRRSINLLHITLRCVTTLLIPPINCSSFHVRRHGRATYPHPQKPSCRIRVPYLYAKCVCVSLCVRCACVIGAHLFADRATVPHSHSGSHSGSDSVYGCNVPNASDVLPAKRINWPSRLATQLIWMPIEAVSGSDSDYGVLTCSR